MLDVLGLALLAGVVMMMARRGIQRPKKLDYARPDRAEETPERRMYRMGDWTFVGILLVLVVSGYVLEGARIAKRMTPLRGGTETEVCAPCHARRSPLRDGHTIGQ